MSSCKAVLLAFLLACFAPSALAQFTLEIACDRSMSPVAARLLERMEEADSGLIAVLSHGLDEASLARGLVQGDFDLAIVGSVSPDLRARVEGMVLIELAERVANVAGVGVPVAVPERVWIIHPQAPSLDARRFVEFAKGPEGERALKDAGAKPLRP